MRMVTQGFVDYAFPKPRGTVKIPTEVVEAFYPSNVWVNKEEVEFIVFDDLGKKSSNYSSPCRNDSKEPFYFFVPMEKTACEVLYELDLWEQYLPKNAQNPQYGAFVKRLCKLNDLLERMDIREEDKDVLFERLTNLVRDLENKNFDCFARIILRQLVLNLWYRIFHNSSVVS